MDGVSEDFEDFSGLPQPRDKKAERMARWSERRANPHRGRMWRIGLVGGFLIALVLIAISLIVAFAPAPYMTMSASALEKSVGDGAHGCHPDTGGWVCSTGSGAESARYRVKSDVAGCWTGTRIGGSAGKANGSAPREISGCVTVLDHLTAG